MKFEFIVIACFAGFLFSCIILIDSKVRPIKRTNILTSKKHLLLNKMAVYLRLDTIRLVMFLISFAFLISSIIVFIIDLLNDRIITDYLGKIGISVLGAAFILIPISFYLILLIYRSIELQKSKEVQCVLTGLDIYKTHKKELEKKNKKAKTTNAPRKNNEL